MLIGLMNNQESKNQLINEKKILENHYGFIIQGMNITDIPEISIKCNTYVQSRTDLDEIYII